MVDVHNTQLDLPEVLEFYKNHKNYEIMNFENDSSTCIIYFSSNGLYYPNNSLVFQREIIQRDRFEWKKNIVNSMRKVIFVRDITKQWYITGLNALLHTPDLLCEFLRNECDGLNIICVGSSAGGYASVLFGCLLNANHVFSFSGQFSLEYLLGDDKLRIKNPSVVKYCKEPSHNKYYSLQGLIQHTQTDIFYFYPSRCKEDLFQSSLTVNCPNVHHFSFDSGVHGQTCYLLH
jgi:hypothetical protein